MLYDIPERSRLVARDIVYLFKYAKQKFAADHNIPIYLCNSYPKCGTHLLSQILTQVPGVKFWNDIVSVQSLSGVMNTESHLRWKVGSAPGGSIVRSHLMFDPKILNILDGRPAYKIFIYRDLRDVVVSHANWVLKEPRIFLHKIYKEHLKSFDERLSASILGVPIGSPLTSNLSQPSIAQDFSRWQGWIREPSTLAIRFEDLVGSRGGGDERVRITTIARLLEHIGVEMRYEEIEQKFSSESLDPRQSHTFRKGNRGAIGGWRERFNERHKDEFKKIAGSLLIELGYEKGYDW